MITRPHRPHPPCPRRHQRGVSLVELLVSSAIGIFLTGGALLVYIESRESIQVSTALARLMENGRFALGVLEPDVRAANFWGMHDYAAVIEGRATDANPLNVAIAGDCAEDFSIDVETPLAGSNGGVVPPGWNCLADEEVQPLSDILVVRHAAEEAVDAADIEPGRLYVRSDEVPRGALFQNAEPTGFSPFAENHALVTHVYYVRPWSFTDGGGERDTVPALRRKRLTTAGGGPQLMDEEIIPGVEDLQVQLGVDLNGDDAADVFVDTDNDGMLDAPGASVVAVRLWLMVRADTQETGLNDAREFAYGDVQRTAGTELFPGNFRRVLLSRTIAVRNL